MLGADVGEMGLGLEGHLEDMIAPEFEDLEGLPQQEHALDRRLQGAGEPYPFCHVIDTVNMHIHMSQTQLITKKLKSPRHQAPQ